MNAPAYEEPKLDPELERIARFARELGAQATICDGGGVGPWLRIVVNTDGDDHVSFFPRGSHWLFSITASPENQPVARMLALAVFHHKLTLGTKDNPFTHDTDDEVRITKLSSLQPHVLAHAYVSACRDRATLDAEVRELRAYKAQHEANGGDL